MSVTEGADVVVHSIADDVWGSEDELTGALSWKVESWDWLCLLICKMSLPMTNSRTNHIKWQYYENIYIITKSKFGNIRIINIIMYVTILFCETSIYLRIFFYLATK